MFIDLRKPKKRNETKLQSVQNQNYNNKFKKMKKPKVNVYS